MNVHVTLPPDLLIDSGMFCKAIAQAICPADEKSLQGIECIVGKIVKCHVTAPPDGNRAGSLPFTMQRELASDDGRTLDQLLVNRDDAPKEDQIQLPLSEAKHVEVVELTLPLDLSNEDRRVLGEMLTLLPPLRYPMSDDEEAAFISAYFNLKDRPEWRPILLTSATIEQRKAVQDKVMRDHQKALREEVADGRMIAVNGNHVRVSALSIGCYFPREQAIAYLDRHGIGHRSLVTYGGLGDVDLPLVEVPSEPSKSLENDPLKTKLSLKEREQVVAHHARLSKDGANNPTMQTAQKYRITDRYVRQLVKKSKSSSVLAQFGLTNRK